MLNQYMFLDSLKNLNTDVWWFQILITVLAASLASLFTYAFSRRISRIAELNNIINNINKSFVNMGYSYINFIDFDERVGVAIRKQKVLKDADLRAINSELAMRQQENSVTFKIKYEESLSEFHTNTNLLDSLLTKRLSRTDYHKYVQKIININFSDKEEYSKDKKIEETKKVLELEGRLLQSLLSDIHYDINNSWLRTKLNKVIFAVKEGRYAYTHHTGKRYPK